MTTNQPYIGHSKVNEEIFSRRSANVEAEFFLPFLTPGMSLVDCGCGQGTITIGLAEHLAPGQVVGFDTLAEHLEKARATASERGLTNVSFEQGDINAPDCEPGAFDAAFIHLVLCYLTDPVGALRQVRQLLKPGGVVGIVDIGNPSMTSAPHGEHFVAITDLYQAIVQRNCPNPYVGKSPYIGLSLKPMLLKAGFSRVEIHSRVTTLKPAQYANSMRGFRDTPHYRQIIELGLASQVDLDEHVDGVIAWGEDPNAWGFRLWPCAVAFND